MKADSLQSGSTQGNAHFGENSRIIVSNAAEKRIGLTEWRSGHDIQIDKPEAVVDAIRKVVGQAKGAS